MLPCRFTGPGIVSTPHMYTRKYRRSRWCIQGRQLAYKWTTGRVYVYAQAASWLVCGHYTRADEHQGSMRIVHKLACHCKAGTSINSRVLQIARTRHETLRVSRKCATPRGIRLPKYRARHQQTITKKTSACARYQSITKRYQLVQARVKLTWPFERSLCNKRLFAA